MAGTGLPIPKSGDVRTQPINVVDIDRYTSAADWARIAHTGEQLSQDAGAIIQRDVHAQQVGYLAEQDSDINRKRTEIRDQFALNPEGFDAAWKGYTDGKLAEAQPWAIPHLRRTLSSEGNSAYSAVLAERRAKDQHLAAEKVNTLVTQTGNDVIGAAMAGTLNTPSGQARITGFRNQLAAGVTAGLHTQEWADAHFEDTLSKAQGEEAARSGVDVYQKDGFAAAAEHLRKNILENEDLSLKPEARYRAFSRGMQAIRLQKQQDAQDSAGIRAESRDLRMRIQSGQPYEDTEVRDISRSLAAVGANAELRELTITHSVKGGARGLDPAQSAERVREFRGQAGQRTANFMRGPLPTQEDLTTVATPGGLSVTVNKRAAENFKGFLTDLEAAGAPIKGIGGYNVRKIAGTDTFSQHAYGNAIDIDQTARNVTAGEFRRWGEANPEKLAAIEDKWGMIGGQNFSQPDWGHWEWGGVSARVGAAREDAADLARVRFAGEIAKRAQDDFVKTQRAAWPATKLLLDTGKPVDDEDFSAMVEAAAYSGDQKWQQEVLAHAAARELGVSTKGMTDAERQAFLDRVKADLPTSRFTPQAQKIIDDTFTKQTKQAREQAREDPVSYQIEHNGAKPPLPIDPNNPAQFRTSLLQHTSIVRGHIQEHGTPPASVLRPAEIDAVKAALSSPDPAVQARVFADLEAGIPDRPLLMATLAKLGEGKGPGEMVKVFAGALGAGGTGDREIGVSILRGQHAMKTEPRYAKHDTDEFKASLDKYIPNEAFSAENNSSETGAYNVMREATTARYADLSRAAGDVKGTVVESRMEQAAKDVTGGIVTHNGVKTIAPRRGMTQAQFDSVMYGLTDADLATGYAAAKQDIAQLGTVATTGGQLVSADYIKRNGILEAVGEGRYAIRFGSDPLKATYAVKFDESGTASLFELNLRDKEPGVLAPFAGEGFGKRDMMLRDLKALGAEAADIGKMGFQFFLNLSNELSEAVVGPAGGAPKFKGPRVGQRGITMEGAPGWTPGREMIYNNLAKAGATTNEIVEQTGMPKEFITERLQRRELALAAFYTSGNALRDLYVRRHGEGFNVADFVKFTESLPRADFDRAFHSISENNREIYNIFVDAIYNQIRKDNPAAGTELDRLKPGILSSEKLGTIQERFNRMKPQQGGGIRGENVRSPREPTDEERELLRLLGVRPRARGGEPPPEPEPPPPPLPDWLRR
jgi:hypothetical protein